jgi:hypothetical protein
MPGQGDPAVVDPNLVDLTRSDIQPRPGVTEWDATGPPPPSLRGQAALKINNPRGYDIDITVVGEAIRPGGRIIIQGRAEVVPGMRPANPNMTRILRQAQAGRMPPGYRVVEIVTDPTVVAGDPATVPRPPDVMGGPFGRTQGGPVSWPNTRIVIEKLLVPGEPSQIPPIPRPTDITQRSRFPTAGPPGEEQTTTSEAVAEKKLTASAKPGSPATSTTDISGEKTSVTSERPRTNESSQTAAEMDWDKAEAEAKEQKAEADKPETTEHGALQQQKRGELTSAEKVRLEGSLPRKQPDGATAKVLKEGRGGYTVVVTNRAGAVVTVIRGKTNAELRGLSRNHHWDPPWE